MSHILIVDDEESICWSLSRLLSDEGHDVTVAVSAEQALSQTADSSFDAVVLDVRLPGMDGLSAMQRFEGAWGPVPIVIMTAFGSLTTAVEAMRNGAFDYLPKPFDLEQAAIVISRALARRSESCPERIPPHETPCPGEELIGTSEPMQSVFKRIALVAPTAYPVLITGESGTGKELVARAVHRHSPCAGAPFVPVHLASLNTALVESELFGHVRGAFTGAASDRKGQIEQAHGGTLFIDEVGEIPLAVQVKLLRVLEQHEVTPVGDSHPRHADFRVIAATNQDLRQLVREGRFRDDLYFRLAVFEIALAPLRERTSDIPLLARHFLKEVPHGAKQPLRFTQSLLDELRRRPWPGNVRELRNAVEHAAVVARQGEIGPEHLPNCLEFESTPDASPTDALSEAVRAWTREQLARNPRPLNLYETFLDEVEPPLLEAVLGETTQNRAAAAKLLGLHRATLRKKLT